MYLSIYPRTSHTIGHKLLLSWGVIDMQNGVLNERSSRSYALSSEFILTRGPWNIHCFIFVIGWNNAFLFRHSRTFTAHLGRGYCNTISHSIRVSSSVLPCIVKGVSGWFVPWAVYGSNCWCVRPGCPNHANIVVNHVFSVSIMPSIITFILKLVPVLPALFVSQSMTFSIEWLLCLSGMWFRQGMYTWYGRSAIYSHPEACYWGRSWPWIILWDGLQYRDSSKLWSLQHIRRNADKCSASQSVWFHSGREREWSIILDIPRRLELLLPGCRPARRSWSW